MLPVKRTVTTHYISGDELAGNRMAVIPKLIQAELARKLSAMTRQSVNQQLISNYEQAFEFGVDDEMLAAMNEVLR